MPVQINELIIRANVVESDEKGKDTEKKSSDSGETNTGAIVKECVELVMEIINNKNQR